MRNRKQQPRLQHVRGQMFVCGMFGNCGDAVLSPRTPPGLQDFGRKAAIVWAASECAFQQQQFAGDITSCVEVKMDRSATHPSDLTSNSPCGSDGESASSASDKMDFSSNPEAPAEGRYSECESPTTATESSHSKPVDVDELVSEVNAGHYSKRTFRSLHALAEESESLRKQIRASGVEAALISLLLSNDTDGAMRSDDREGDAQIREEAFITLELLSDDDSSMKAMATPEMLSVVVWYLRNGSNEVKEPAAHMLEKLSLVESFKDTMGSFPQVMEETVNLLREENQPRLVKLATKTLLALCLAKENRCRAVEADAVPALIEMLPVARSATAEKALAILELLATLGEGKVAMSGHALAVPILVDMILRISDRGTEYAAGALYAMCGDSIPMQEAAVMVGAPTQLLLLLQSDCTPRAKRKAMQLLKVLHKLWGEDPCNPDSGCTKAIHY